MKKYISSLCFVMLFNTSSALAAVPIQFNNGILGITDSTISKSVAYFEYSPEIQYEILGSFSKNVLHTLLFSVVSLCLLMSVGVALAASMIGCCNRILPVKTTHPNKFNKKFLFIYIPPLIIA